MDKLFPHLFKNMSTFIYNATSKHTATASITFVNIIIISYIIVEIFNLHICVLLNFLLSIFNLYLDYLKKYLFIINNVILGYFLAWLRRHWVSEVYLFCISYFI